MAPPLSKRRKQRAFAPLVPPGWGFQACPAIGEGISLSIPISTPERGAHPLPPLVLAASPFGLWTSTRTIPLEGTILVLPKIHRLIALPWLHPARQEDKGAIGFRPMGELFRGLREYRIGDSLRQVHWKSSAKRGQLLIKECESENFGSEVRIFVDPAAETEAEVEQVVSIAASIAAHLSRQGIETVLEGRDGEAPMGLELQLAWLARMERVDVSAPIPLYAGFPVITGRHSSFPTRSGSFVIHCGERLGGDIHCPPGCEPARALGAG